MLRGAQGRRRTADQPRPYRHRAARSDHRGRDLHLPHAGAGHRQRAGRGHRHRRGSRPQRLEREAVGRAGRDRLRVVSSRGDGLPHHLPGLAARCRRFIRPQPRHGAVAVGQRHFEAGAARPHVLHLIQLRIVIGRMGDPHLHVHVGVGPGQRVHRCGQAEELDGGLHDIHRVRVAGQRPLLSARSSRSRSCSPARARSTEIDVWPLFRWTVIDCVPTSVAVRERRTGPGCACGPRGNRHVQAAVLRGAHGRRRAVHQPRAHRQRAAGNDLRRTVDRDRNRVRRHIRGRSGDGRRAGQRRRPTVGGSEGRADQACRDGHRRRYGHAARIRGGQSDRQRGLRRDLRAVALQSDRNRRCAPSLG